MINVALLGFGRIGQMHAQNIYLNKNEDEVSWFQKTPNTSIEIINSIKIKKQSKIDRKIGTSWD